IAIGQGAEDDSIHDAEDRGCGSDSQSQRQNCRERKGWRSCQGADGIAYIPDEIFDQIHTAHIAAFLLVLFEATDGAQGGSMGFFGCAAGGEFSSYLVIEVKAQLFVEVLLYAGAAEDGSQTKRDGVDPLFPSHAVYTS